MEDITDYSAKIKEEIKPPSIFGEQVECSCDFPNQPFVVNNLLECANLKTKTANNLDDGDKTLASPSVFKEKYRILNKLETFDVKQEQVSDSSLKLKEEIKPLFSKVVNREGGSQLIIPYSNKNEHRTRCHICQEIFQDYCDLKKHLINHTGEKPYSCYVCKKSFSFKSNLKTHYLIHTGEKPHSCFVCKTSFAQKDSLKKHMLVHTRERPHVCHVCKKAFKLKSTLNRHIRNHTSKTTLICHVCKESFELKGSLKTHMLLHAVVSESSTLSGFKSSKGAELIANFKYI